MDISRPIFVGCIRVSQKCKDTVYWNTLYVTDFKSKQTVILKGKKGILIGDFIVYAFGFDAFLVLFSSKKIYNIET